MFDPQNYEGLIPLNKGFFQGHFGQMAFRKAFVRGKQPFIVFRVPSLTFFIINVENKHFLIASVWVGIGPTPKMS